MKTKLSKGYSGKSFECDFEDEGVCGWKIESVGEKYKWQRVQSGDELPESGPTSDYTTGTATGVKLNFLTFLYNTETIVEVQKTS